MNATVRGLWVAGGFAGLAALVFFQHRQIHALKARQPSPPAREAPAVRDAPETATDRETVPAPVNPRPGEEAEAAPAQKPSRPSDMGPMAEIARLTQSPGMKNLIRAQQKGQLDLLYGSLFKYLELSGVDVNAVRDLLLDRQMAILGVAMESMNSDVPPRERANRMRQASADFDARIRAMLGPEHSEVFDSYEATQAERAQVTLFKNALPAEDRLTEDQEDRLILALHEERSRSVVATDDFGNRLSDPSALSPQDLEVLLRDSAKLREKYAERAVAILTPSQLEQFKTSQAQQQAMLEAAMKMSAGLFRGPGTPSPTPAE